MGNMEFLSQNELNTTTQYVDFVGYGGSTTATIEFLFDRNRLTLYERQAFSGGASFEIIIAFGTTTLLDRVVFRNTNFSNLDLSRCQSTTVDTGSTFSVFHSIASASITLDSPHDTYIQFSTITATAIRFLFYLGTSLTDGATLQIGEVFIGNQRLEFERNPAIRDYKAGLYRKQVRHEMPDGGIKLFNVKDKFRSELSWDFVTENFKDDLKDVYDDNEAVNFVPFPTTTGWDGSIYEVVISGGFNFNYSDNVRATGWGGDIKIEETAGG